MPLFYRTQRLCKSFSILYILYISSPIDSELYYFMRLLSFQCKNVTDKTKSIYETVCYLFHYKIVKDGVQFDLNTMDNLGGIKLTMHTSTGVPST